MASDTPVLPSLNGLDFSPATNFALQAAARMPAADPVPAVQYVSHGRLLIIGSADKALPWARLLSDTLQVEVLTEDLSSAQSVDDFPLHQGKISQLKGWLGAFEVEWDRGASTYDLVLDLTEQTLFDMHLPPQGYFRLSEDPLSSAFIAKELVQAIGEFEKPKYFAYDQKLCAHSRSRLEGCNKCIEVCTAAAIAGDGDGVKVEPNLCMGCGACATVCPSGAMRYNYPSVAYQGEKIRVMLAAYSQQAQSRPVLLLHREAVAHQLLSAIKTSPQFSSIVPLEVHQVPSIGLDILLYAIAAGARQVLISFPENEAPQYTAALAEQVTLGEHILNGLGYSGMHFVLAPETELQSMLGEMANLPEAQAPQALAAFKPFNEKRTTLEFCINFFVKHAPNAAPDFIALPDGSPFGTVEVNQATCTLCMSCVSSCPAAALRDTPGQPMLKFVERNCVQCGLCEKTCPENAISLAPRLLLTAGVTQPRTLHEDVPFHCVSCNKVFGTTRMVTTMEAKLSGHSMFSSSEAKRRLRMCGDCRVIDMMKPGSALLSKV